MTDPLEIIRKYYKPGSQLYETLVIHSEKVRDKALECINRRGLEVDKDFVASAAMVHDIGIFRCDAPDIYCHGSLPYICHGVEGRKILEAEGLPQHALVCERHTGSGLTIDDIIRQKLPLPHRDMTPQTLEEKLICYADKFYSKSGDIRAEKSFDRVLRSMERHGSETLSRFLALHSLFG
jgi:hypothetical protein